MTLLRNGGPETQSSVPPIDILTYQYNGNQLLNVTDTSYNLEGFDDSVNVPIEYTYDFNGNMKTDRNKNITNISYNHLNLPIAISINGGTITYMYNATGQKVSKTMTNPTQGVTSNTEYFGGFQYNNGVLQFFPTAEGYVKNTIVDNANTYDYVFNYTDHLGNIRLSYGLSPVTQILTTFEQNHYYPYGLKHGTYNNALKTIANYKDVESLNISLDEKGVVSKSLLSIAEPADIDFGIVENSGYHYKLNGKEYQDELALNMYAMDMRQYDPAIGRWVVQDPVLHESLSPYNAFDNNPVFWADPSGADSEGANFQIDIFGRNKFTDMGVYIAPMDRGRERPDIVDYQNRIYHHNGSVASSNDMGTWIKYKIENKHKVIYDFDDIFNKLDLLVIIPQYEYKFIEKPYDWGNIDKAFGFAGTLYDGLENAVANKYWWMDAKGNYNSTKILKSGANGKYVRGVQGLRNGYSSALKAAKGYRVAGNVVGGLGLVVTAVQWQTGQISTTEASIDAAFGVIGFVGPWGAAISGGYFLFKTGYEYYTDKPLFAKP